MHNTSGTAILCDTYPFQCTPVLPIFIIYKPRCCLINVTVPLMPYCFRHFNSNELSNAKDRWSITMTTMLAAAQGRKLETQPTIFYKRNLPGTCLSRTVLQFLYRLSFSERHQH